ncbi:uncharacterized protein LOC129303713 [Prosopis cineraria]|uniref:uncharacterized protein LOC129303713 n=1 Tax=Prosopis cineraria TaxID=364024 RepID=UPI00240FA292|nr:uncharacterized protein LOC129303713 [Prosopis cineraria]XP_054799180.1 uncharacterized protein LOC129303713 [Prosopis cineraria]
MENKNSCKNHFGGSSSATNFDQLFGPKDPSSSFSSSSSIFGSIFPPPSAVGGSESRKQDVGDKNYGPQGGKGESRGSVSGKNYQNESTMEPSNYYTSSIYYGGQENYFPKSRTTDSHHNVKKDSDNDDPNGDNPNSASRGNWWQGSLYY